MQTTRNREKQISVLIEDIEKLRESILDTTSVSGEDLYKAIDVVRLEGQIRDLRMENAIVLSQCNKNAFPEFLPILILAFLSIQIAMLDKKLTISKVDSIFI